MVDLQGQYLRIKPEIDQALERVLMSTAFIQGPEVNDFASALGKYVGSEYVIPCANGTDALQIAMMALNLQPGDEVNVEVHAGGTITLTPLHPKPSREEVSRVIKKTMKDYSRTMKKLA